MGTTKSTQEFVYITHIFKRIERYKGFYVFKNISQFKNNICTQKHLVLLCFMLSLRGTIA